MRKGKSIWYVGWTTLGLSLSTHTHTHTHTESLVFCKVFFNNCIYFWLCWVFIAACRLSLLVVSRGYSLVAMRGLLTVVAFLAVELGL